MWFAKGKKIMSGGKEPLFEYLSFYQVRYIYIYSSNEIEERSIKRMKLKPPLVSYLKHFDGSLRKFTSKIF